MRQASFFRFFTTLSVLVLSILPCTLTISNVNAQAAIFERPWLNTAQTPDQRADALIAQMTLVEKVAMLGGVGGAYVGDIPANTRLGIPALHMQDGPAGVGDGSNGQTLFPAPINQAASWNPSLMNQGGQNLGAEDFAKGVNVALYPTLQILRNPVWGRSFQSLGEDPYLTSQMAVADIQGLQSQHVIANANIYIGNDQEYDRTTDSANVDERTLQEIYMPAFRAAVQQGQVGSVMCSYNLLNNVHACEQPYSLHDVLKTEWNFPGFVVSDWGATHSTVQSAKAGLDIQMPDNGYYGSALQSAVQNGQVSLQTLDNMVHRVLRSMFAIGLFDYPTSGNLGVNTETSAHAQFAENASEQGTVLLQNSGNILPLNAGSLSSVAVIGSDGSSSVKYEGDGSAGVNAPSDVVSPLQGITSRAGSGVNVQYNDGSNQSSAASLAQSSNVAIVFANDEETEGADRSNLSLPNSQDQLISAVAQANPNTIVVLNTGAPVLMPWLSQVKGVVEAWYPGQEDGNAIAALLFGDVNPSGKLPMTFPASNSQVPANTQAQYPGINDQSNYSEKLDVGYRYYDANNLTPLFPFGYGLSYTNFAYSNLSISGSGASSGTVTVQATMKNTGSVTGADVAQLYVSFPSSTGEPPKLLKGFQKVTLTPGQAQTVSFTLNSSDLSYWDATTHNWEVPQGTFGIMVGNSSRNLPLQGGYQVTGTNATNWVEDALPAGATAGQDGGDAWNWVGSNPAPFSGSLASQSSISSGEHQHFFTGATTTITPAVGSEVYSWVYLDPNNPPTGIMLQWNDGQPGSATGWSHRAYWGTDCTGWGTDGTVSRFHAGDLPPTGAWELLAVPASDVGLENVTVSGMAFTTCDGRATYDHAGTATGALLSYNQPTAESSEYPGYPSANVTDGDLGTRWSSQFSDPQWIQIDLGAPHAITGVNLDWETAYGKAYQIQVSNDGSNWTTIYSTTNGPGGNEYLNGLSGYGRYVRMYGTQRGTQWGYSLWEFQVFGF